MIRVKAVLGDGVFQLSVSGHEGHVMDGQVCAAVTAITQTALLGLEQYAHQYPEIVSVEVQEIQ